MPFLKNCEILRSVASKSFMPMYVNILSASSSLSVATIFSITNVTTTAQYGSFIRKSCTGQKQLRINFCLFYVMIVNDRDNHVLESVSIPS